MWSTTEPSVCWLPRRCRNMSSEISCLRRIWLEMTAAVLESAFNFLSFCVCVCVCVRAVWSKTLLKEQSWNTWWWVPGWFRSLIWLHHRYFIGDYHQWADANSRVCSWHPGFGFLPEPHVHQTIRGGRSGFCRLAVQNDGPEPAQHPHPQHWVMRPPPPCRTQHLTLPRAITKIGTFSSWVWVGNRINSLASPFIYLRTSSRSLLVVIL